MAMKMIRKLAVPVPKGNDEVFWMNIGALMYDAEKKKFSVKLNAIPIGIPDFEGWVNCFELDDKEEGDDKPQRTRRNERAESNKNRDFDDDIPF